MLYFPKNRGKILIRQNITRYDTIKKFSVFLDTKKFLIVLVARNCNSS